MSLTPVKRYPTFLLFIISFFVFSNAVYAQETTVKIKLITATREPLSFVTVEVLRLADTTNILRKVSDSSGNASFKLGAGNYLIRVQPVNYKPVQKGITVKTSPLFITLTAESLPKNLEGVVVTSRKPLMRQEDDKTIVDPENLAASSTNAYEIMEKTPGLFVDQDGNVYLSSMTPAKIYINGREQKMSGTDIATMLKSLPPNAIASIEILRTPSARYDASGSGGIVNIILKKGVKIGLTGSVNAGMNQGRYGNQFVGFNLNNNNGSLSTYLNVQYSHRKTYEQVKTDRHFAPDSLLSQDALTIYPAGSFYAGYGAAYQLNKKWEISYDGRFAINNSHNSSNNPSVISKISTGAIITSNNAAVTNDGRNLNFNESLTLKYKIDSAGSEWSTDISYNHSPVKNTQVYYTVFYQPALPPQSGDGNTDNRLHFFSAQTNFIKKFPHQFTFETGLKTSDVSFTGSANYFRMSGGSRVKDNFRTSAYHYTENIHSAYLQGSKNFSGITVKLGVRAENTNMRGSQTIPADTSFTLKRTDLFPYIYISRSLMKIMGYDLRAYLVYRRTITRPSYDFLNPFPRYVDQYLYETGNPSLRPQFTQNYEANISVDERPIFAVGVNETKDIFNQVVYQVPGSRSQAYRTYDNLGSNKETYFRILGAIPPGGKYFIVAGAQYNHNAYNGLYENKPLLFTKGSWSIFTYQTLKFTPTTQFTLNGFARFNGQLQFYELGNFGALNLSLTQQLLKKKLIITLSGSDILFTNKIPFTLNQGTVNASGIRINDTKRFGLNLRYNFGFRRKDDSNFFNIDSPEKSN